MITPATRLAATTFLAFMVTMSAFLCAPTAAQSQSTIKIGVLAFRGKEQVRESCQPLADYLRSALPGKRFEIVPVGLVSVVELIDHHKLDFLITNPGNFVNLSDRFGLAALATRRRGYRDGNGAQVFLSHYGSVIFTRADSSIETFADLKGKVLAAVSPKAFGGFQMAWRELTRQNIKPFSDLKSITFTGFPQDDIVKAVLSGRADAGTVRSGLLEQMAREGRLELDQVKVLRPTTHSDYPFKVTSELYPEWAFAALSATDRQLVNQVALALLKTSQKNVALPAMLPDRWAAPVSYQTTRALVRDYTNATLPRAPSPVQPTTSNFALALILVLSAIIAALAGYLFATIGFRRAKNNADPSSAARSEFEPILQSLTGREREILCHLCKGLSSKQIAELLGISPKTVEFHRANLLQKTGAGTTPNMVRLATAACLPLDTADNHS